MVWLPPVLLTTLICVVTSFSSCRMRWTVRASLTALPPGPDAAMISTGLSGRQDWASAGADRKETAAIARASCAAMRQVTCDFMLSSSFLSATADQSEDAALAQAPAHQLQVDHLVIV